MSGKAVRRAQMGLAARMAAYKASGKTPDQGYNPPGSLNPKKSPSPSRRKIGRKK